MAGPSRDHRCAAVEPPTPQPNDKQRRHCLSADHVECAMYRAARAARVATLASGAHPALVEAADRRRRPLARPSPILLEPPRLVDSVMRIQLDRAPGQLALIALMIVAFAIVALTRLSSGTGGGPGTSASPSVVGTSPSPRSTPVPTASPIGSVAPSAPSLASPPASFRTTYTVKKGDTLLSIARKYGTTTARLRQLNGLTSTNLKIGQVLKIP